MTQQFWDGLKKHSELYNLRQKYQEQNNGEQPTAPLCLRITSMFSGRVNPYNFDYEPLKSDMRKLIEHFSGNKSRFVSSNPQSSDQKMSCKISFCGSSVQAKSEFSGKL